jgi:hypothetical protein
MEIFDDFWSQRRENLIQWGFSKERGRSYLLQPFESGNAREMTELNLAVNGDQQCCCGLGDLNSLFGISVAERVTLELVRASGTCSI